MNKKVLIITQSNSYFLISIKEKLEAEGLHVVSCEANVNAVSRGYEEGTVVLFYTADDAVEDKQLLTYLKDLIVERDAPVFIMGDRDDISAAEKTMPVALIKAEFARPINVKDVVTCIAGFIKDDTGMQKKKLLVVDDSGMMLRKAKEWFEGKYQVALAPSGASAIKCLSVNKPDLILLDYEMPVADGKQVMEMIKAEPEFSNIPIIFLTSHADRDTVMEVKGLKPEGYLLKTMPSESIIKTVDDFFEKQRIKAVTLG